VQTSSNFRFADIRVVRRVQIEAGRAEIEEEDLDAFEDSNAIRDYIEVEKS